MTEQALGESRRGYWLLAALVLVLTAALRLYHLDEFSMTLDESTVFVFAQSILEHGYPVVSVGSMQVPLATYELMPYIMAPFIALFGTSDFVIRLPSLLFAVATAYLIFYCGCKWFNRRTGVLAGLLFAFMPWAIYWGQSAFHPSTAQFFGLLTLMQIIRLQDQEPVPVRTAYLAALFFCCAYLTWEGIGFILPILATVALIMRWGNWTWLKNKHLWFAVAIVSVVILAQATRRILLVDNYLFIGEGRGDVTTPELAMLKQYYSPYFYADQLFGRYPQFFVAIVFGLGLVFVRRHWHFRFLAIFVVTAVLVMANLLSYYSFHYIYFALPALIICIAATTTRFVDWLGARAPLQNIHPWSGAVALAALAAVELATAGAYGLKTYEISKDAEFPKATGTRLGLAGIDYKRLGADFLWRYVPGDAIVTYAPFSLRQYTGQSGNIFMQSWTYMKVVYDPGGDRTHYLEKFAGGIVVRNMREFEDVLAHNNRVWFVVQPWQPIQSIVDAGILTELESRAKLVSEGFDGRVYLWTR